MATETQPQHSLQRVPPPPGLSGTGALIKLSHGARAKSLLGWTPVAGAGEPIYTPDGLGVILTPSPESLRKLAQPPAPAEPAGGDGGGKGRPKGKVAPPDTSAVGIIPKGTSAVVTCSAQICPTRGWAVVAPVPDVPGHAGVAVATHPIVLKGMTIAPQFLVHAVDADVVLRETTQIGIAGLLS